MSDLIARVAVLETHVEHVRKDLEKLSSVPVDLAILKTNVGHLPTKGWLFGTALGIIGALSAIFLFADRLKAFFS